MPRKEVKSTNTQMTLMGSTFAFKDTKFMTAEQKRRVLRQWVAFLKSDLSRTMFTKELYHHLINHCMFIAHYDIVGFYGTYFVNGDDTLHFLSQFDNSLGIPKSIEYDMTSWVTNEDYYDINIAMCQVATRYLPELRRRAALRQREADLEEAERLLDKHGINLRKEVRIDN